MYPALEHCPLHQRKLLMVLIVHFLCFGTFTVFKHSTFSRAFQHSVAVGLQEQRASRRIKQHSDIECGTIRNQILLHTDRVQEQ